MCFFWEQKLKIHLYVRIPETMFLLSFYTRLDWLRYKLQRAIFKFLFKSEISLTSTFNSLHKEWSFTFDQIRSVFFSAWVFFHDRQPVFLHILCSDYLLDAKLNGHGVNDKGLSLILCYLTNRRQRTKINCATRNNLRLVTIWWVFESHSLFEKCPDTEFFCSEYGKIRTRKNSVFGQFSRSGFFCRKN